MTTTELVTRTNQQIAEAAPRSFSPDQVDLLKRTICKGATDDEFALFIAQCQRTGLDPFARQIHAVKRSQKIGGRYTDVMTIQTGIDGYRLIADRTNRYAPGREPSFEYDADGNLFKATAYVKKLAGGTWHEVAASAIYAEYVQKYEGKPIRMWEQMPHNQLAKCAEALALRRAFPADLSGIYTNEEMAQADSAPVETQVIEAPRPALAAPVDTRTPVLKRIRVLWDEVRTIQPDWHLSDEQIARVEGLTRDQLLEYGKDLKLKIDAMRQKAVQPTEQVEEALFETEDTTQRDAEYDAIEAGTGATFKEAA